MPLRASAATIEAARAGWDEWRARRLAAVRAPLGNLALVETLWPAPGEEPSPEEALAGWPRTATATRIERTNVVTGEPEHGIRVWDADSPAIRHFETIDVFPFTPDWVIEAVFTPVSEARLLPFEHAKDDGRTRDHVVPGDITFTLDGTPYNLAAFDDGGTLLLVFGDATNGSATYGGGRFLTVEPEPGGRVVLDFNRAFAPPCAFSPHFNCPLPPPRNRFGVPVEAGEKLPVFRDGFLPH
ncbi:hypothetical protein GCM10010116_51140 [Microbispora rosea subsp. aerata]|nr:DUF1684 domain-containing protein [Microbispora rosea]GGO25486.1 hypothetical protein GCM10010116_51140 [Microbispora rosea subsp. aerata]GIH58103.1 hypothetical protein Mro02_50170 [Microbispora rosea subsp. aerata]GLJ86218.1 hypothetical protein GCM10017588_49530 [Microbispora rosea subsp. aerata]